MRCSDAEVAAEYPLTTRDALEQSGAVYPMEQAGSRTADISGNGKITCLRRGR